MNSWRIAALEHKARQWRKFKKRIGARSKKSPWWDFTRCFATQIKRWLSNFIQGKHSFSPMQCYASNTVWGYLDRLMLHLIHTIIKPTSKPIISDKCCHLSGPSAIKKISNNIKTVLASGDYHCVMRLDIQSYYSSINHQILLKIVDAQYDNAGHHQSIWLGHPTQIKVGTKI